MQKLIVEEASYLTSKPGTHVMRVGGFADGELEELKMLEHKQSCKKLLDMLDERNDDLGTIWWRSDIVYSWWFDNEYAYVTIGN